MPTTSTATLHNIATRLRIDCVRSTSEAGSGHPTTCLSAAEIVAALFFAEMRFEPKNPRNPHADRFVLSKGHAAPILYAAWAEAGLDMVLVGLESDDPAELKRVNKGSRVNVNDESIDFLHSVKVKVWGAQIVFADWLADRFDHLMEYNKRLGIECPQFTIHTPLPGTVDWQKYKDELITQDRQYFDFLHPVLPTALPIREFIDHYVKLYRECHMSRHELMDMVRSGRVPLSGVIEFAKKFRNLTDPETYRSAIDLHERAQAGQPA
jgi:radical SAM superfamily enzyme YgiQ (UPF0313 family)